jgi:hypothetical protein
VIIRRSSPGKDVTESSVEESSNDCKCKNVNHWFVQFYACYMVGKRLTPLVSNPATQKGHPCAPRSTVTARGVLRSGRGVGSRPGGVARVRVHWKTVPVISMRPAVACRARAWLCACEHVHCRTMATVLEETLTSHRHRVCHSGAWPRRLRMPSGTHVPTRHTRRPGVH